MVQWFEDDEERAINYGGERQEEAAGKIIFVLWMLCSYKIGRASLWGFPCSHVVHIIYLLKNFPTGNEGDQI